MCAAYTYSILWRIRAYSCVFYLSIFSMLELCSLRIAAFEEERGWLGRTPTITPSSSLLCLQVGELSEVLKGESNYRRQMPLKLDGWLRQLNGEGGSDRSSSQLLSTHSYKYVSFLLFVLLWAENLFVAVNCVVASCDILHRTASRPSWHVWFSTANLKESGTPGAHDVLTYCLLVERIICPTTNERSLFCFRQCNMSGWQRGLS